MKPCVFRTCLEFHFIFGINNDLNNFTATCVEVLSVHTEIAGDNSFNLHVFQCDTRTCIVHLMIMIFKKKKLQLINIIKKIYIIL